MGFKITSVFKNYQSLIREIILYGMIGGFSSCLDTGCYILFTRLLEWNKFFSNLCSVNIGILSSFLLNTYLNFKKTDQTMKRAFCFFVVGYCGMGLSMLMLYIGANMMGYDDIPIKIAAIFIVAAFQFILNKLVTYSRI